MGTPAASSSCPGETRLTPTCAEAVQITAAGACLYKVPGKARIPERNSRQGDPVCVVDKNGNPGVTVGRVKIERRPLCYHATQRTKGSSFFRTQNHRLARPGGETFPWPTCTGDSVRCLEQAGRHFE